ncbi:ester cyclase [Streptomyces sp. NBC_01476]|uniref:nuclear transport factor 2 family protein n=1 Tax=Streptomyces sp. NBC_01476 TaxID=2903881 RepID=UPI002E371ECD|nr:nuclear transport factor 2 family protein [Streptomyces sp. NBC_01476]
MSDNADVVRRYLRVFETQDMEALKPLVAEDVRIHGAGMSVRGRRFVEGAIRTPGLSHCRLRVDDLFAAGDRVVTAFTLTYRHDLSGRDIGMTGVKSYRLKDGVIVEFWGETDLYTLLRQAALLPVRIPSFADERVGLKAELPDWVDAHSALYQLGRVLGIFPLDGKFMDVQYMFWDDHPLGNALRATLLGLVDAGVLETRGGGQEFRWALPHGAGPAPAVKTGDGAVTEAVTGIEPA